MGLGGVYYQKYLDTNSTRSTGTPATPAPEINGPEPELANVISTAEASALQDSSAGELLQEINSCYQKSRLAPLVIVVAVLFVALAIFFEMPRWVPTCIVIAGTIAHVIATRSDFKKKALRLDYALEKDAAQKYVGLLRALEQFRSLGGLWRVSSSEVNPNTKYHAGAQYSVNRKSINSVFEPPPFITTSMAVFLINTGIQRLYFLPDRLLVYEGSTVGAVNYLDLNIASTPVTFVEDGQVPPDAETIGRTWRYTNKNGGPDRRFANNPEIPIVRYAGISLQSATGLNYSMEASNIPKAEAFVRALKDYAAFISSSHPTSSQPPPHPTQNI